MTRAFLIGYKIFVVAERPTTGTTGGEAPARKRNLRYAFATRHFASRHRSAGEDSPDSYGETVKIGLHQVELRGDAIDQYGQGERRTWPRI